jgi:hypothetical protein
MRFEVPQFIEIEDKIFGPFTWRQFLYLSGGVGMSAVMLFTLPIIFFILFGIPLALLAGALAFYPINNRPFSFFLESVINYSTGQKLYLWKQGESVVYKGQQTQSGSPAESVHVALRTQKPKRDIASLARKLELQAIQKPE